RAIPRAGRLGASMAQARGARGIRGGGGEVAELAIKGGRPVRSRPFHPWPVCDEQDEERLLGALRSGRWAENGPLEREFEKAFAPPQGAPHGVALSNAPGNLPSAP